MRAWQRWWPMVGLAFVVLFVVTFVLVANNANTPAELAKDLPKWQAKLATAFVLGTLSMIALLAFFAELRALIRVAAPERQTLGALSFGSAAVGAALVPGSLALLEGVSQAGRHTPLPPSVAEFANDAQYPFLAAGAMFVGVAIFCASLALLRSGAVPDWLCWFGIVSGVLCLAALAFFPLILWILWVLVASIVLLSRTRAGAPAGTPAV